ncbi:GlxA family transcriptional regulator [Mesorhizobium sp. NZP2077]|uniref:GlxA family transcriptional regulator n=1 Tax=Mesorhizobium sp. NZP2077 TaxID=2483404 RepID=UPI0015541B0F|nr:GlxA family transcriptional regulator [Mesorhizobium sp. NZP2077]QKC86904.1 GlxA family transcriptional regulator [Mesorhizobium sp. NZP2077]QKD20604.1 GlxA family transcriptional regulator [Mesorhizobium sp. NZP2077]
MKAAVCLQGSWTKAMNAHPDINAINASTVAEMPSQGRPIELAILLFPGFSQLALHAFLEPFHIANTVMRLKLFKWRIAGFSTQPVEGSSGISVAVDVTTDELNSRSPSRGPDHLIIVAGEQVGRRLSPQCNNFLRMIARRGVPISALGTASWLLAQTGLLAGTRCTIHWSRLAAFSEVFSQPDIRDTLFVKDGQFSTCAGELASFDLAVDMIANHVGGFTAQQVCRHATVEGQRSGTNRQTGPTGLAFAGVSDKLLMSMRIMDENVECPLSMSEVAKRAGVSRRQLERLFAAHVHMPPVRHYLRVRVEHGKRLIEGTSMAIVDIAMACGFVSPSHFAKCFRLFNGVSPQQCRLTVPAWVGPGLG